MTGKHDEVLKNENQD